MGRGRGRDKTGRRGEYEEAHYSTIRKPSALYGGYTQTETFLRGLVLAGWARRDGQAILPARMSRACSEPKVTVWLEMNGQADNGAREEAEADTCRATGHGKQPRFYIGYSSKLLFYK